MVQLRRNIHFQQNLNSSISPPFINKKFITKTKHEYKTSKRLCRFEICTIFNHSIQLCQINQVQNYNALARIPFFSIVFIEGGDGAVNSGGGGGGGWLYQVLG